MREIKVRPASEYRKRSHYYPGMRKPKTVINKGKIREMVELFNLGVSRTLIAQQMDTTCSTVTKYLKAEGYEFPKKERRGSNSDCYPYDGPRFRVARFCKKYALVDKHSPRFSRPRLWVEEIISESEKCGDLIVLAKQLDEAEIKKSET